jgi:D-serine deaminase-like pyridoxal phosphate-dependent protein
MFSKPTLLINEAKCRANIKAMADKAKNLDIAFRPHFKTHQSHEVGRWFRELGVDKIAVSSVPMAEYFARDGWNDITIAFPYVDQQAEKINYLANKAKLQLLVSSKGNALLLCKSISSRVDVYVEIDTGQGRSGIQPENIELISEIIEIIGSNSSINFYGFLSHAGHSYNIKLNDIEQVNIRALNTLNHLKNRFINQFPSIQISYGDTPTSWVCNTFYGVNELRPGNFAFFDMQQASRGVCSTSNIAIALACPVVAIYPERCQAIIWGGAVHLSKDFYIDSEGNKSFGAVCILNPDNTWSEPIHGIYIESISQEHGILKASNSEAIQKLSEGDMVAILPPHSCLTAHEMGEYWVNGKGILSMMK